LGKKRDPNNGQKMCALLNTATGRKHDSTGRGRGGGGLSMVPPLFFDAVRSKKPPPSKRGGGDDFDGPFVLLESLFVRRFPTMIFEKRNERDLARHISLSFSRRKLYAQ